MKIDARLLILILSLFQCAIGCSSENSSGSSEHAPALKPTPDPLSTANARRHGTSGAGVSEITGMDRDQPIAGIAIPVPEHWAAQPVPAKGSLRMVDAKYWISSAHGDIELTITSIGGTPQLNIERWTKQIDPQSAEKYTDGKRVIAGIDSFWIDCSGFYTELQSAGRSTKCRMIGVIVPRKPKNLAIKIVGPVMAVDERYDDLIAFLESLEVASESLK